MVIQLDVGYKIITLFAEENFQGSKFTISRQEPVECFDMEKPPFVMKSVQVFPGTVCKLFAFVPFARSLYIIHGLTMCV